MVSEHSEEFFVSEKARDEMNPDLVVCYEDESLCDVIIRMNEWNILDIPLLDRKDRVIADLDILCLLEMWLKKGSEAF